MGRRQEGELAAGDGGRKADRKVVTIAAGIEDVVRLAENAAHVPDVRQELPNADRSAAAVGDDGGV
jgi:hypothetical protein